MQGNRARNAAQCCHHVMRTELSSFHSAAETVPLVSAAADSASDYSTWSVQQLMKLYYGITNS